MATTTSTTASSTSCTTNAHDLDEAAKLQARLLSQNNNTSNDKASSSSSSISIPSVSIDEGAHKYVLITATAPPSSPQGKQRTFIYSKKGASYHRNVAEFLLPQLESSGYSEIRILGGGRILRDDEEKKVHIFGYSYGFGRADHVVAKEVVEKSGMFEGYAVTWSNQGY